MLFTKPKSEHRNNSFLVTNRQTMFLPCGPCSNGNGIRAFTHQARTRREFDSGNDPCLLGFNSVAINTRIEPPYTIYYRPQELVFVMENNLNK